MRMDVVHRDICTFVLTKPLAFYAGLDRERCSRYAIQFRSCSAWRRLPLRRAPALKLPSHEPGKWGHHDKPAQLALHGPLKLSNADTFLLKVSAGWPPRLPPQRARDIPSWISPAAPCFDSGPNSHPGPGGWPPATTNHNLAPAHPSPRRRPIFQSTIRFGMTGWVGDPTTGSPDLPSPPVGGPLPLVQPGRPLRGSPLCSGNRFCPVETSWFATDHVRCPVSSHYSGRFAVAVSARSCVPVHSRPFQDSRSYRLDFYRSIARHR
jgi:hypothetical protein